MTDIARPQRQLTVDQIGQAEQALNNIIHQQQMYIQVADILAAFRVAHSHLEKITTELIQTQQQLTQKKADLAEIIQDYNSKRVDADTLLHNNVVAGQAALEKALSAKRKELADYDELIVCAQDELKVIKDAQVAATTELHNTVTAQQQQLEKLREQQAVVQSALQRAVQAVT